HARPVNHAVIPESPIPAAANPGSPSPAAAITVPRQARKRHTANVLEGERATYARKRISGLEPQTFACRQRVTCGALAGGADVTQVRSNFSHLDEPGVASPLAPRSAAARRRAVGRRLGAAAPPQ